MLTVSENSTEKIVKMACSIETGKQAIGRQNGTNAKIVDEMKYDTPPQNQNFKEKERKMKSLRKKNVFAMKTTLTLSRTAKHRKRMEKVLNKPGPLTIKAFLINNILKMTVYVIWANISNKT